MRIDYFHYFLAVAQHGSIAKAATHLMRNRTTISMAISALEDELNAKLFERSGNKLVLSRFGLSVQDDAQRLVTLVNNIKRQAQSDSAQSISTLTIGRDDMLPEDFWRKVIKAVRAAFPQLQLRMRWASSEQLVKLVQREQVDLAYFTALKGALNHRDVCSELIGQITMSMVASRSHPLVQLAQVNDADLKGFAQISYLDSHNKEHFYLPHVHSERLSLSSFELIFDAIDDELGWGFVPEPMLQWQTNHTLSAISYGLNRSWHPVLLCTNTPLQEGEQALRDVHALICQHMQALGITQTSP